MDNKAVTRTDIVKSSQEKYYTYMWLRENGTPYYVGKGSGFRAFDDTRHNVKCPPMQRVILQHWPSENDALRAEKFLIFCYGRLDLGTGCLRNLTDGGENPPSHIGKKRTEEHNDKIRKALLGNKSTTGLKDSEATRKRKSEAGKRAWIKRKAQSGQTR